MDYGGAARANWKGVLKVGEVSCPVALYTAASTAERIAFHILNRKTGHRVHREFVDAETGDRVEAKELVKGYETGPGEYIPFEPKEIAKAVPEADKTFDVEAFVPCDQVDDVYFDRPYYLAPATPTGADAFALMRDGIAKAKVAAVARGPLPPSAVGADPALRRGSHRAHAQFRLRGAPGRGSVRRAARL
jgi:DNA end-binding protein Ku